MSHTPGPWDANRWRVCAEPNGKIEVICDTANNKETRNEENAANARLIAAAPELLAACENAMEIIDHRNNITFMELAAQLRAAIAKAKGQP